MKRSFSSRGQAIVPVLDQVDLDRGRGRHLDRDAAELAIALRRMAIAEIEVGILVVDREIEDRARTDVGQVHVAAPIVRLQRSDRFDLRD